MGLAKEALLNEEFSRRLSAEDIGRDDYDYEDYRAQHNDGR